MFAKNRQQYPRDMDKSSTHKLPSAETIQCSKSNKLSIHRSICNLMHINMRIAYTHTSTRIGYKCIALNSFGQRLKRIAFLRLSIP